MEINIDSFRQTYYQIQKVQKTPNLNPWYLIHDPQILHLQNKKNNECDLFMDANPPSSSEKSDIE